MQVDPPARSSVRTAWLVLATVMVGTLLVGLDRTVINLAIPDIIDDFGVSVSTAGWLGTGYIISDAVFIPVFGKLADLVGHRRVHLWGLAGFLGTSVLCGLAPGFWVLVFFRVLQGFVGAAVFPTALSLISEHFADPTKRRQAYGIWSASFAASIALGPLVAGPLIDNLSWRWVFYINFPISLAAIFMLGRFIPADRVRARLQGFDWLGAVLLGVALTAACLVLERGDTWGWKSSGAVSAYLATVVFGSAFVWWETRVEDPLVAPRLFRSRVLVSALVISFVTFSAMVGSMFLIPVFAQQFLGYEATGTGFLLLPMAVTLMVVASVASGFNFPARLMVTGGVALSAIGISLLSGLDIRTSAVGISFPLALLAAGLGLGMAPLTSAATDTVSPSDFGMASGVLNLTRNVAAAIGIATFGTLLTAFTEANVIDLGDNAVINNTGSGGLVPQLVMIKAQIEAYGEVFAIASTIMFLGALLGLTLKAPKAKPAPMAAEA